jgi:hypothetical protein
LPIEAPAIGRVVDRSARVKAGAARPGAERGCGLDPVRPAGISAAMPSAPFADGARRVRGSGGSLAGMFPGLSVAQHGVEGDQHFAHQGDGGGLGGFAGDDAGLRQAGESRALAANGFPNLG